MPGSQKAVGAPRLNFDVTTEHIAEATPKDSSHCMIADALREAMPNADYITVDLATIRWTDTLAGRRYIYLTPIPAQMALLAFDAGEPVEPFTVQARAAQMIYTGAARKARRIAAEASGEELPKREAARLAPHDRKDKEHNSPVKVGGKAMPVGPLAKGAGTSRIRLGRRRQYGLRAFVR